MKVFALTGITGFFGQTVCFEIIKNNIDKLDDLMILCLGRFGNHGNKISRLREIIHLQGWMYFLKDFDEMVINKVIECLVPINIDLLKDNLNLLEEDYKKLKSINIDYFIHIAGFTEFTDKLSANELLSNININGTQRILDLIDSLNENVKEFIFISSAYVCGKKDGLIAPNYINLNNEFRNFYEKSKLIAEIKCREHFIRKDIKLKVFRPSLISGRIYEKPLGFVSKFDGYLAWSRFFVRIKSKILKSNSWDEIISTSVDIPIRIHTNPNAEFNVVPCDFAAKVLYYSITNNDSEDEMHLVSCNNLPISTAVDCSMRLLNIKGWQYIDKPIKKYENNIEKLYYKTVGQAYAPHLTNDISITFDSQSMEKVCDKYNIAITGINDEVKYSIMFKYAIKKKFGMELKKYDFAPL